MDNVAIGTNAGLIWDALEKKGEKMEVAKLQKATKLADDQFWAAIGWLSREDKLTFTTEVKGKKTQSFYSLND